MKLYKGFAFVGLLLVAWMTTAPRPAEADVVTYYHNDPLGSPVAVTDEQGRVVWKANYKPYGEKLQSDADSLSAGDNNRWYGGHVFDMESGFSYMGARYYDPKIGRFMGIDPEYFQDTNVQSFGRYTYANNNPYAYVDPNGELPVLVAVVMWNGGKAAVENIVTQRVEMALGMRTTFSYTELAGETALGAISGPFNSARTSARAINIAKTIAQQSDAPAAASASQKVLKKAIPEGEGPTTVIGKVKDLERLSAGERSLLDRLPDRGSPKANWKQNSGVLRQEMGKGQPIRDASVDASGDLINNTGFLRAERDLLENRGWTYNPQSTMWMPPPRKP